MKGLQTHKISIGDSLQKIARLYEVSDWRDIAEVNGLESPYIDSVFQSQEYEDRRVAKLGDIILIPSFSNNSQIKNIKANEEIQELSYGLDLDLYNNEVVQNTVKGELSEELTDIKLCGGLKNLSQQLLTKLSVKKGALLLHPEFGSNLHLYMNKLDKQEDRNKIIFEIERCLREDFRVKEVKDIEIIKVKNGNYAKIKIIPIEPGEPFEIKKFLGGE